MIGNTTISLILLFIYFLFLVYSVFGTKTGKMSEKTIDEFAIGGRSLHSLFVVFILLGVMIVAAVYTSYFSWTAQVGVFTNYLLVYGSWAFLIGYIISKRIWIWGRRFNLVTQPDYVQLRYNSKPLTYIFSSFAIIFELPWVIMEFAAMGIMLKVVSNGVITREIGTLIVGLVVTGYILYSGMKSIATTDIPFGIITMLVAIIGSGLVIYKQWGSVANLFNTVFEVAPQNLLIINGGGTYGYWMAMVVQSTLGIMGYCSFFTRIYSNGSILDAKKSNLLSGILSFLLVAFLFTMATGIITMPEMAGDAAAETAFYTIWIKVLGSKIGPWLLGLAAITVLGAGLSTVSVVINTVGVIISENYIKPYRESKGLSVSGKAMDEIRLKTARYSVLGVSIFCIAIAMLELPALYTIGITVYEGICQVVPMILLSLYWKRSNKYGALIGLIAGIAIGIYCHVSGNTFGLTGGFIGVIFNVAIHVICGFIFPRDPKVDELFGIVQDFEDGLLKEDSAFSETA